MLQINILLLLRTILDKSIREVKCVDMRSDYYTYLTVLRDLGFYKLVIFKWEDIVTSDVSTNLFVKSMCARIDDVHT